MMTREQAVDFAKSSADMAWDQRFDHVNEQDAIDSYRDNVRDTLNDEKAAQYEPDAFDVYDARIKFWQAK